MTTSQEPLIESFTRSTSHSTPSRSSPSIPILLLKTPSPTPARDPYSVLLSSTTLPTTPGRHQQSLSPTFHPVLTHTFARAPRASLHSLLSPPSKLRKRYGGLIFTSQRAVEGFGRVLEEVGDESFDGSQSTREGQGSASDATTQTSSLRGLTEEKTKGTNTQSPPSSSDDPFPIFVVGKATATALSHVLSSASSSAAFFPHHQILGQHTGDGAALVSFILEHFSLSPATTAADSIPPSNLTESQCPSSADRPEPPASTTPSPPTPLLPLLFLTGEQRRDIIPRTLRGAGLRVHELVLYATTEREEFASEFETALMATSTMPSTRWIVVFSPQGTAAMLSVLGLLHEGTGKVREGLGTTEGRREDWRRRWEQEDGKPRGPTRTMIMSIGPTTRDFLREQFGFEVDVRAGTPSPEGVRDGILDFEREGIPR